MTLDGAGNSYGDTLFDLEESYSHTMFAAEKSRTLSSFAAYRAESEGNAKVDTQAAKLIADASQTMTAAARDVIDDLHAALTGASLVEVSTVWSTANTQLNAIKASPNARTEAATAANNLKTNTKSANAQARENTVKRINFSS